MGTGTVAVLYVLCEFVSMWCVCMPGWVCKCVHVMSVGGFASVCMWCLWVGLQVCAYDMVSMGGLQMCACGVNGWFASVCMWCL